MIVIKRLKRLFIADINLLDPNEINQWILAGISAVLIYINGKRLLSGFGI